MPVKLTSGSHVNSATDHLDLLDQIVEFLTNANTITAPAPDAGNTGDGTMSQPTGDEDAPTETWTVTVTDNTTPGSEVWSVTGSVSGAQASATTGVAYDNIVQFTITAGATAFAVGDEFTFDVELTMGPDVWTLLKDATSGLGTDIDREVYLKGLGPSDAEAVHVNIRAYTNVPDNRWNFELQGATSFNTLLSFDEQPNAIPSAYGRPQLLFWDSTINFVLVADSRRFVLIAYAAGEPTQSSYCGFITAFGSPTEYPTPLFIGGCHYDTDANSSAPLSDDNHIFFANNLVFSVNQKSNAHVLTPGGSWARLRDGRGVGSHDNSETCCFVWPTCYTKTTLHVAPAYGAGATDYYFLPQATVNLHTQPLDTASRIGDDALIGELTGVRWTTGFGLTTGDIIEEGADDFFVFQDTNRTGIPDFLAVLLS